LAGAAKPNPVILFWMLLKLPGWDWPQSAEVLEHAKSAAFAWWTEN
jgi:hypothetical protein